MKMNTVRIIMIINTFVLLFLPSICNAEGFNIIDLDQVESRYERLYYMPSAEEAMLRMKHPDISPGITTLKLSLDQYNEGWTVTRIFFSKRHNKLMTAIADIYGDDSGIYGKPIIVPYVSIDDFFQYLEWSEKSKATTMMWEKQYGPYFLWDIDTKNQYYSTYHVVPVNEYSDFFPEWGMPDEKSISLESARQIVEKAIKDKYNIDSMDNLPVYEDVRYIHGDDISYWMFNYWVFVQKDGQTYSTVIFSLQQLYDTTFGFLSSIDPDYLPCFMK